MEPRTTASTNEWDGGDRYGGPGDTYYRIMRGTVTDAPVNSDVKVWFTGAGETSDSFTFHVDKATANDVLILADTDYTGTSNFPAYTGGDGTPPFLSAYTDAVDRVGADATTSTTWTRWGPRRTTSACSCTTTP